MKATIGRMVEYLRHGSPDGTHKAEPSPAVITKVLDQDSQECQLFVMNPNGVYFCATSFSEQPKPGHWSWPPHMRDALPILFTGSQKKKKRKFTLKN